LPHPVHSERDGCNSPSDCGTRLAWLIADDLLSVCFACPNACLIWSVLRSASVVTNVRIPAKTDEICYPFRRCFFLWWLFFKRSSISVLNLPTYVSRRQWLSLRCLYCLPRNRHCCIVSSVYAIPFILFWAMARILIQYVRARVHFGKCLVFTGFSTEQRLSIARVRSANCPSRFVNATRHLSGRGTRDTCTFRFYVVITIISGVRVTRPVQT